MCLVGLAMRRTYLSSRRTARALPSACCCWVGLGWTGPNARVLTTKHKHKHTQRRASMNPDQLSLSCSAGHNPPVPAAAVEQEKQQQLQSGSDEDSSSLSSDGSLPELPPTSATALPNPRALLRRQSSGAFSLALAFVLWHRHNVRLSPSLTDLAKRFRRLHIHTYMQCRPPASRCASCGRTRWRAWRGYAWPPLRSRTRTRGACVRACGSSNAAVQRCRQS